MASFPGESNEDREGRVTRCREKLKDKQTEGNSTSTSAWAHLIEENYKLEMFRLNPCNARDAASFKEDLDSLEWERPATALLCLRLDLLLTNAQLSDQYLLSANQWQRFHERVKDGAFDPPTWHVSLGRLEIDPTDPLLAVKLIAVLMELYSDINVNQLLHDSIEQIATTGFRHIKEYVYVDFQDSTYKRLVKLQMAIKAAIVGGGLLAKHFALATSSAPLTSEVTAGVEGFTVPTTLESKPLPVRMQFSRPHTTIGYTSEKVKMKFDVPNIISGLDKNFDIVQQILCFQILGFWDVNLPSSLCLSTPTPILNLEDDCCASGRADSSDDRR